LGPFLAIGLWCLTGLYILMLPISIAMDVTERFPGVKEAKKRDGTLGGYIDKHHQHFVWIVLLTIIPVLPVITWFVAFFWSHSACEVELDDTGIAKLNAATLAKTLIAPVDYTLIGTDGKEYGPLSAEQVRTWIVGGRADLNTKIKMCSSNEWKSVAEFSELASQVSQHTVLQSKESTQKTANLGLDDLEKLQDLKTKGIITQEEFDSKKMTILGL